MLQEQSMPTFAEDLSATTVPSRRPIRRPSFLMCSWLWRVTGGKYGKLRRVLLPPGGLSEHLLTVQGAVRAIYWLPEMVTIDCGSKLCLYMCDHCPFVHSVSSLHNGGAARALRVVKLGPSPTSGACGLLAISPEGWMLDKLWLQLQNPKDLRKPSLCAKQLRPAVFIKDLVATAILTVLERNLTKRPERVIWCHTG